MRLTVLLHWRMGQYVPSSVRLRVRTHTRLTIGLPILVPYNRVRDQLLYKRARRLAAMMTIKSSAGVTLRGEH